MEKNLLEGNFSNAIVECFNIEKFDYNLLEPLQKLLRLSPAVAATLARPEMFFGIKQKLSNKKPDIRLNLLRLVRSIWDPKQGQTNMLKRYGLLEAIQSLAEHDPTVLVKNMASEFVKDCLEKEENENSGGRRVVSGYRRSSHNTPPDQNAVSTPVTPTHKGRSSRQVTLEEPSTPQRRPLTPRDVSGESVLFRERTRENKPVLRRPSAGPEGLIVSRRPSMDTVNYLRKTSGDTGASPGRSRLSRTAALKTSRSSMASFSSSAPKEQQPSSPAARREREPSTRIRGETKSIDSGRPSVPPAFSSTISSRRRTKTQTSQDLR